MAGFVIQEENMYQELFLLIWNQELWILFVLVLLDKSSDQIISFLDKVELETIGPKVCDMISQKIFFLSVYKSDSLICCLK